MTADPYQYNMALPSVHSITILVHPKLRIRPLRSNVEKLDSSAFTDCLSPCYNARMSDNVVSLSPSRPRILRRPTVVMVFFVASRILGVVRDIVISHQFGTTRVLDVYFAAFNIPDLIFNVIAGGALSSAFIPTFPQRSPRAILSSLAIGQRHTKPRRRRTDVALRTARVIRSRGHRATVSRGFTPPEQALTRS